MDCETLKVEHELKNKTQRSTTTLSTSVSPYQYITSQLRVDQLRLDSNPVNQFSLHDQKLSPNGNTSKGNCFEIREVEEENSKLQFADADRLSTIRHQPINSFMIIDAENSDACVREWLLSQQKQQKPKLHWAELLIENKMQETAYCVPSQYCFNTLRSRSHKQRLSLESFRPKDKTMLKIEQKRGINLTIRHHPT